MFGARIHPLSAVERATMRARRWPSSGSVCSVGIFGFILSGFGISEFLDHWNFPLLAFVPYSYQPILVANYEFDLQMTFSVPPQIDGPPVEDINFVEGQPLDLQCVSDGYPAPTMEWIKDGQPFDYSPERVEVRTERKQNRPDN